MNTTLAVVVSAIVILITALVVITIFSGGMQQIGTISQAKTLCTTNFITTCQSTGQTPPTWTVANMNVNGVVQACSTIATCSCAGTGVAGSAFTASCS